MKKDSWGLLVRLLKGASLQTAIAIYRTHMAPAISAVSVRSVKIKNVLLSIAMEIK